eukprot:5989567-Amphidinium_carterae.1
MKARMAKVISNQLTNVLSTRVAFLNICIVVVQAVLGLQLTAARDVVGQVEALQKAVFDTA